MTADQLSRQRLLIPSHWTNKTFTPNQNHHSRSFFLSLKGESILVHLPNWGRSCLCPTLGSLVLDTWWYSLGKAFYKVFFSHTTAPLLWCKGWGEKCLLSRQPFHRMNPSPLGKYKKRNRIMHVFLKFAFMITLNFVYYYLCIIEIECTLFFTKAPVFIVIYILWVEKLFLQPSHILKTNG